MLDFSDFGPQVQVEDNLIVAISRAWYNASYTMASKPIKSLELHYTIIQFLMKRVYLWPQLTVLIEETMFAVFTKFMRSW